MTRAAAILIRYAAILYTGWVIGSRPDLWEDLRCSPVFKNTNAATWAVK